VSSLSRPDNNCHVLVLPVIWAQNGLLCTQANGRQRQHHCVFCHWRRSVSDVSHWMTSATDYIICRRCSVQKQSPQNLFCFKRKNSYLTTECIWNKYYGTVILPRKKNNVSHQATTPNSKKMTTNKCVIYGKPEIAVWPSKPEVLISATVWSISLEFRRQTFYQGEFAECANKWL